MVRGRLSAVRCQWSVVSGTEPIRWARVDTASVAGSGLVGCIERSSGRGGAGKTEDISLSDFPSSGYYSMNERGSELPRSCRSPIRYGRMADIGSVHRNGKRALDRISRI